MDIVTLAAWGELLGGIGVIVSLVYLAGQIRQNSKLVRASAATATAQVHANHVGYMVQDPEVARLYFEGLEDIDSISENDRHRLEALLSIQVQGLIARHEFAEERVAGLGGGEQTDNTLRWLFGKPGGRWYWERWSRNYSRSFHDYVDRLIRHGDAADWG